MCQDNDPEIIEFLNTNRVRFSVVGDHRFVIDLRDRDVPAGPEDWLVSAKTVPGESRPGITDTGRNGR